MHIPLLLQLTINAAIADDCDCDSVLKFAGRETLHSYEYNSTYASYHDEACRQGWDKSTKGGTANISVPTSAGIVTLGGSRYQTQSQFNAMCSMRRGESSDLKVMQEYLDAVNPAAVSAWTECKNSSNGRIKINHSLDASNIVLIASFPDLLEGNSRRVATTTAGLEDCKLNDEPLTQNATISYSPGQTFRLVCGRAREADQRLKEATITFTVDTIIRAIKVPGTPPVTLRKQVRIDKYLTGGNRHERVENCPEGMTVVPNTAMCFATSDAHRANEYSGRLVGTDQFICTWPVDIPGGIGLGIRMTCTE